MTDRLLTTREVGEMLGLSSETVLRRWRAGELPGFRLGSNVLRFRQSEIEAWLEERHHGVAIKSTLALIRPAPYPADPE